MILSSIDPRVLHEWAQRALWDHIRPGPSTRVTLHVNPHGWELRCGELEPLPLEPLPKGWCGACDGNGRVADQPCGTCGGSGRVP